VTIKVEESHELISIIHASLVECKKENASVVPLP
jgi:hypothetical protein